MNRLNIDEHGPIIKKGRVEGKGYRDIAKDVERETGVSVTYAAIRKMWVEKMGGADIDEMIEKAQRAVKAAAMKEAQEEGKSPSVDPVKAQAAIDNLDVATEAEELKCVERVIRLLIKGNIKAAVNGERIKTEYLQYLKLLKQIENKK